VPPGPPLGVDLQDQGVAQAQAAQVATVALAAVGAVIVGRAAGAPRMVGVAEACSAVERRVEVSARALDLPLWSVLLARLSFHPL
jgi:hypothetical protein